MLISLRRAHFHPRERGKKRKESEKRGGKGGGDDPPMDVLKEHWIRRIVEEVHPEGGAPTQDNDDNNRAGSLDPAEADGETYQTAAYDDLSFNPASLSYPPLSYPVDHFDMTPEPDTSVGETSSVNYTSYSQEKVDDIIGSRAVF
jgi:hypothetical protein